MKETCVAHNGQNVYSFSGTKKDGLAILGIAVTIAKMTKIDWCGTECSAFNWLEIYNFSDHENGNISFYFYVVSESSRLDQDYGQFWWRHLFRLPRFEPTVATF